MTGIPCKNVVVFHSWATRLRWKGHEVINPAEISGDGGTWHDYLKADIKALCDCDTLAYLPGWESSKGAQLEIHLAHRLGIEIVDVRTL
jgi:hypothetical protein